MAREYVFVDEWEVEAPQEEVFRALADARTYPDWWRPVYIGVEGDDEPSLGCATRHHFKGVLPYTLRTRSQIVEYDPPHSFKVRVEGDLTGQGTWTLTPRDGKVHVRFDWIVIADRPLLRALTPILRPVFRFNHNWSVKRAIAGLEPYARGRSEAAAVPATTTRAASR
jgi:uncharacterized protein YndB with AHSA1/START domain